MALLLYMAPSYCIHRHHGTVMNQPPCACLAFEEFVKQSFSNYLCGSIQYNLTRIVNVILLMMCSGISISAFYSTWLIVFPRAEFSERRKLMGVLWLLLLAVAKHMDTVKCLKLYLSCFKRSQRHVKK